MIAASKTLVADVCGKEHETVGMGVVTSESSRRRRVLLDFSRASRSKEIAIQLHRSTQSVIYSVLSYELTSRCGDFNRTSSHKCFSFLPCWS